MITEDAKQVYPEYKEYISGTYENLSYEEKIYYVNLIKQSERQMSCDFCINGGIDDSIEQNIILFFFDCLNYLYKKQNIDKNIFINLNIIKIMNIIDIDHIGYTNVRDKIIIRFKNPFCENLILDTYLLDYYMFDSEYFNDKMKDQIRIIINDCSKNIKEYQKLINDNKKKIDTLLSKFHFSEIQGGIEL